MSSGERPPWRWMSRDFPAEECQLLQERFYHVHPHRTASGRPGRPDRCHRGRGPAGIEAHSDQRDDRGRRQVVCNGHLPERTIQTGIGPVEVRQPRVHDRRSAKQWEHFTSAILLPYLRRTRSPEGLIPWPYRKGVSTSDFTEALQALLGPDAPGPSATTVTWLKAACEAEYEAWSRRSLAGKPPSTAEPRRPGSPVPSAVHRYSGVGSAGAGARSLAE
jgi:hypothetical protein